MFVHIVLNLTFFTKRTYSVTLAIVAKNRILHTYLTKKRVVIDNYAFILYTYIINMYLTY